MYMQVYTLDDTTILKHIPALSLPVHLGGVYPVNHLAWLRKCLCRYPEQAVAKFFEGTKQPQYITAHFQHHAANVQGGSYC